jgi:hypothetical protein
VPRHSRPGVRGRLPRGRTSRARARHRRRERRKHKIAHYRALREWREHLRRLRRARRRRREDERARHPSRLGWGLLDGEWVPGRFLALLEEYE